MTNLYRTSNVWSFQSTGRTDVQTSSARSWTTLDARMKERIFSTRAPKDVRLAIYRCTQGTASRADQAAAQAWVAVRYHEITGDDL